MAENYIQVPVDSSGKKVRTQEVTVGINQVHIQYFIPCDNLGDLLTVNTDAVTVISSVLPTGASTESTLSSLNAKVTACNTGSVTIAALPNEGQQTMANSISVALASDQSVVPVKPSRPTSASVDAYTVSTTATQLITTSYGGVKITNNGIGDLYIGVANTVTTSGATMGLVVYPGGCFTLMPGEWEGAVWGIYSVAASSQNVSVYKGAAGA